MKTNTVNINGNIFQTNANYRYGHVQVDTKLITIDDCVKGFNFVELLSKPIQERFGIVDKYVK